MMRSVIRQFRPWPLLGAVGAAGESLLILAGAAASPAQAHPPQAVAAPAAATTAGGPIADGP